ncbi:MAG: biopolymer transporter ExbD [Porphyromonadaceae bacterium]|nr:MAG: biopolymer transporter ExbD [Porphyromonadaceae bacterium]
MSKFNPKGGKKETPGITTASLPDIMFMLLFFFMVSTTLRQNELKITTKLPYATEITKLEKKSLVSYIFVGSPRKEYAASLGTESRIQLDDNFAVVNDIRGYIAGEWEKRDEADRPKMTVSLKADEKTKMGIINEIKTELRKAEALKINYSAKKRSVETRNN